MELHTLLWSVVCGSSHTLLAVPLISRASVVQEHVEEVGFLLLSVS